MSLKKSLLKKVYMSFTKIRKSLSPLALDAFVSISSEIKRGKKTNNKYILRK